MQDRLIRGATVTDRLGRNVVRSNAALRRGLDRILPAPAAPPASAAQ